MRECTVQARAEIVSLGGAVCCALALVVTAIFFIALASPAATNLQRAISGILMIGSWAYVMNSASERLSLIGSTLEYDCAFGQRRRIALIELQAVVLRHEGFNLEHGIETIELHCVGRTPDRISLGPCWQRRKLDAFIRSVDDALQSAAEITLHM